MLTDLEESARRSLDVPWDELRETRVQQRALDAFREAKRRRRVPWPAVTIAVAAAVAAIVVVLVVRMRRAPELAALDVRSLDSRAPESVAGAAPVVELSDGSRAVLSPNAHVEMRESLPERVTLEQRGGSVRYDVVRNPARRFVVSVEGVTVTVLGTMFDVDVAGPLVSVHVLRGRVRATFHDRRLTLSKDEQVTIDTRATPEPTTETRTASDDLPEAASAEPGRAAPEAAAPADSGRAAPADSGKAAPEAAAPATTAANATMATAASATTTTHGDGPAAELLRQADKARASGDLDEAASVLRALTTTYPHDRRATVALFTLGGVERQRANLIRAAHAFEACGNAQYGDGLAEAALAWSAAGQAARARADARRYLDQFPNGVYRQRLREIAP